MKARAKLHLIDGGLGERRNDCARLLLELGMEAVGTSHKSGEIDGVLVIVDRHGYLEPHIAGGCSSAELLGRLRLLE